MIFEGVIRASMMIWRSSFTNPFSISIRSFHVIISSKPDLVCPLWKVVLSSNSRCPSFPVPTSLYGERGTLPGVTMHFSSPTVSTLIQVLQFHRRTCIVKRLC
ncbi:hypothetical protein PMAYCL1PPCAC_25224 [Pristionchus mayeri]|uniref:Uncharacterized protein n=1 Tax=Pristionchus mayeri TaxID=1317129 RepID=A0AAN5D3N9_9BILA|nr:hypothetical protein PMAYCL1PPCAC_25224 [Pristionchus mayeri]